MAGLRVFYEGETAEKGENVLLGEAESRHLSRVLRARIGEAVELLNGRGLVIRGEFAGEQGRLARVRVQEVCEVPPRSPQLCLVQALPKAKGMDGILRQAVELGVSQVFPVLSDRSEVRLDKERGEAKQAHWGTVAREACKQSGSVWLPEIHVPMRLDQVLSCLPSGTIGLVGSLEADARPVWEVLEDLTDHADAVAVAVGPEGDFSPDEYARLRERGFLPVRLTPLVLRVETAAVAMLSVVEARLGAGRSQPSSKDVIP